VRMLQLTRIANSRFEISAGSAGKGDSNSDSSFTATLGSARGVLPGFVFICEGAEFVRDLDLDTIELNPTRARKMFKF
jgi:hypothetical protein